MIVLWVLLALLLLFVIVLLIPVRCKVLWHTGDEASAWLLWLFFKIQIFPPTEKPKRKKRQKKKQKPHTEPPKTKVDTPEDFAEKLSMAVRLLQALKGPVGMLIRQFRVNVLRLEMVVAKEDAAQTAIAFGKVNAVLYGVYAVAKNILKLCKPQFSIRPDYSVEKGEASLEMQGWIMPIVFLGALLRFGIEFVARSGKTKTGDKSN